MQYFSARGRNRRKQQRRSCIRPFARKDMLQRLTIGRRSAQSGQIDQLPACFNAHAMILITPLAASVFSDQLFEHGGRSSVQFLCIQASTASKSC
jgi:hypothetical protein